MAKKTKKVVRTRKAVAKKAVKAKSKVANRGHKANKKAAKKKVIPAVPAKPEVQVADEHIGEPILDTEDEYFDEDFDVEFEEEAIQ